MEKQKTEGRKRKGVLSFCFLLSAFCLFCDRREPLTAEKAQQIIRRSQFQAEPIYAEVPQRVWWGPRSPKDDFDEKALRTLRNLERAGFVTITASREGDGTESHVAKVTEKGFRPIGTAPSMRGPAFRARICEKRYDGLRNFVRHPTEPTVGHAELIWHYDNPTPFYEMFETKINKPLRKPFASHISFYYKDGQWQFDVVVRKTEAE